MTETGEPRSRAGAASWLAWGLCALSLALVAMFVWLEVEHHRTLGSSELLFDGSSAAFGFAFPIVGAFLAARRPRNPIGWLMVGIGISFVVSAVAHAYSEWAPLSGNGSPEAAQWAAWIGTWSWAPGWGLTFTMLLLLFPDGKLPTPGWRWAARLSVVAVVLETVGSMLDPNPTGHPLYRNPLGVHSQHSVGGVVAGMFEILGTVMTLIAAIACLVALVGRYRRSRGDERQQMKWFAYGGVLFVVLLPANTALANGRPILGVIAFLAVPILPVCIAIGVMKYRLYDIDVVISRTVVYAVLAAFITAVYVGIVVGVGSLVGRTDQPNVGLSIVATAIVAIAFQPVRERVQRFANRLVYGRRATPYEALSRFTENVGAAVATEDLLPRVASVLADATGATRTQVWVRSGPALVLEASVPATDQPKEARILIPGQVLPALPGATASFEVRHGEELLGALTVTKRAGESLTPTEDQLAARLAAQAGLVLRNVGLTEQLKERMEELRASRQRIVAAADEERRRLERAVHDGAQEQLTALSVKAKLAEDLAERDPEEARGLVEQLQAGAGEALENLRDLARGVYPPLLADRGLPAALEAQARKLPFPAVVEADGIGRYPQGSEAAIYFCVLEALQNVAKYSGASNVVVRVEERDDRLTFTVTDDGIGFDPGRTGYGTGLQSMADRLAALDGELLVRSTPGKGATVAGRLPVRALEHAS